MQNKIIENIVNNINENSCFLITSHINPDGDSLGSQLAFYHLLRQCGKYTQIVNMDSGPTLYRFLPGIDQITDKVIQEDKFDAVFVLDCSSIYRTGEVERYLKKIQVPIINIDHHPDNDYFGDINWVDTKASSVGEMIFYLTETGGLKLSKEISVCLYTAILTDTGSFNYANTTAQTYKITAQLVECGVRPEEIARKVYQSRSVASVRLLGYVLSNLQLGSKGRLCWGKITTDMLRKAQAKLKDTEEFVSYLRSILGVEVAVLFMEDISRDKIRVNFRSKGKVDVSKIAHELGGGGHPCASGAILNGTLDEVIEKVLSKIREYL